MKTALIAGVFALFSSAAHADLLSRWEVAEEATMQRLFDLYGNSAAFQPWTPDIRNGKACLLEAMLREFGTGKVEGFVAHKEATAARRMSYSDPLELTSESMRATTANRIWFEEIAPLAQACGSDF